jgi:transposase InsO family protein
MGSLSVVVVGMPASAKPGYSTVAVLAISEIFATRGEAKMELFDYIEVFYNQRRRHSTIGQISPAEFERRQAA